jgi:endonuclease YncB( thermonuclease family)
MRKLSKLLLVLLTVCIVVSSLVACDGGDDPVDYAASLKFDPNSGAVWEEVTVKSFIDGDTTHFYVPTSIVSSGVLKARYLAVNTPESTGQIEEWGKKASNFTKSKLNQKDISIIIESDNDTWNTDSTGDRYLVWVWYKTPDMADYRCVNIELLQEGLAMASNSEDNRYGATCMKAIDQAKLLKYHIYSDELDPDHYYGSSIPITLKELKTNIDAYLNKKVCFEGVIVAKYNNTSYVEAYDEETDRYYSIPVYEGFKFAGAKLMAVGNKVRIIGNVQYYENGGTYQISDLQYFPMDPTADGNISLVEKNVGFRYKDMRASTLNGDKVTLNIETEDGFTEKEFSAAELSLYTAVEMKFLKVKNTYTTDSETDSDGSISITCEVEGQTVTVRTVPLRDLSETIDPKYLDENGIVKASYFEGKTLTVKGIVDYFNASYQIKVFKFEDIIVE